MKTYLTDQSHNCLVYPGDYFPGFNSEDLVAELKKPRKAALQSPVTVSEEKDHVKVEVAMPGMKREEFVISIHNNMLAIAVMHKKTQEASNNSFQLHEFSYECFSYDILLPSNVETDFVSAIYRDGILSICMPKTILAATPVSRHVVVY